MNATTRKQLEQNLRFQKEILMALSQLGSLLEQVTNRCIASEKLLAAVQAQEQGVSGTPPLSVEDQAAEAAANSLLTSPVPVDTTGAESTGSGVGSGS